MTSSEGKVTPGQAFYPPPATIWNNMVDAGRDWSNRRLNGESGPPIRPRETDILRLKNSSGADRRQGEILKISGKVLEVVTDEHIWLGGVAITDGCRFGILKNPLLIDEVDAAQVSGVCMAKVNVTDVSHTFAVAVAGEYVLQSASSGPVELLYAPAEVAEAECVVRFAGGAGGGGSIMHFTIDDVDCDTGEWIVTPTHYTDGCDPPPGADPYTGEYCVTPFCGSPFTDEELVGSGKGVAAYTYNLETCRLHWLEVSHCAEQGC